MIRACKCKQYMFGAIKTRGNIDPQLNNPSQTLMEQNVLVNQLML